MTTTAALPPAAKGIPRTAAWFDWLQMLSGAGLVLFMWTHLLLVSSVLLGTGVMNSLAAFFEETGMAQVGGPLIFIAFLLHFVVAARKVPFRFKDQKTAWRHATTFKHTDSRLWIVQVASAMLILIMGAIHLWVVLTDLPITAEKSAARVQDSGWLIFYLILLPLVELHVGIGFYRIGVKWGFIKRKARKSFKSAENILTGIFILIGLITLARFAMLTV